MTTLTLNTQFEQLNKYFESQAARLESNDSFWVRPLKNWVNYTQQALKDLQEDPSIAPDQKEQILARYRNFIRAIAAPAPAATDNSANIQPSLDDNETFVPEVDEPVQLLNSDVYSEVDAAQPLNNDAASREVLKSYAGLALALSSCLAMAAIAMATAPFLAPVIAVTAGLASLVAAYKPEFINLALFGHPINKNPNAEHGIELSHISSLKR